MFVINLLLLNLYFLLFLSNDIWHSVKKKLFSNRLKKLLNSSAVAECLREQYIAAICLFDMIIATRVYIVLDKNSNSFIIPLLLLNRRDVVYLEFKILLVYFIFCKEENVCFVPCSILFLSFAWSRCNFIQWI